MSASTRTNSARPPARSIVSGDVAFSRESSGSGPSASCWTFGSGFFSSDFGFGVGGSRRSTRLSDRTGAGGGWDTTRVTTGADGVTAAGGGGGGGAAGGAGGGVTRVAVFGVGWRCALGGASGFGVEVFGGAGSGAGSCAKAGPAATAHAQHTAMSTDACRSNDRPVISLSPSLLPVGPSPSGATSQPPGPGVPEHDTASFRFQQAIWRNF